MSWSLLGDEGLSFHCTKNVRVKSCTLTKTIRNKRTKQNKKLKRLDKRLSLLPCTLMCVRESYHIHAVLQKPHPR